MLGYHVRISCYINYSDFPLVISGLIREVYKNISQNVSLFTSCYALKCSQNYPSSPDSYGIINDFEASQNFGDYYGQRIRGWFLALQTGNYTFYSSCNHFCELYLSNNTDPKNKVLIVNQTGRSNYNEFNKLVFFEKVINFFKIMSE